MIIRNPICNSLICAAMIAATSIGSAAGLGGHRSQVIEELKGLRQELNITADQKTRIRGIIAVHKVEIQQQITLGKRAREDMKQAVQAHGSVSTEASQAADGIGRAAKSRALLVAKILTELRPILTREQLKTLESARESFLSGDW